MSHHIAINLHCPELRANARVYIDGRLDASYYSTTPGLAVMQALYVARTGEFPNHSVVVVHADDPLVVEVNRLVELHLQEFHAALLQALKRETTKCEFHVLRPTLQICFQLPDCDVPEPGAHGPDNATPEAAASSNEGRAA